MCSGVLAQMVERPLRMAGTFLLLTATFMFCFPLVLIVFLPVLPYCLSTVTVTYAGGDSCPPAQNHSRHLWDHEIDHGVLLYYSLSAISYY